jgi:hypothetical protein
MLLNFKIPLISLPNHPTDQNAKGAEAKRKYLDCSLTLQEMYDSYVAHSQANDRKPVKKSMYYHVMRSKFQIYFPKPPSKEQVKKEPIQVNSAAKKVIKIAKEATVISDQPSTSQTIIYNTIESSDQTKTVITPTFVYAQPIQDHKGYEGLSFVQQIASPIKTSGNSAPAQVIILKNQGMAVPTNQNQNIIYYSPANNQGEQMIFYQ